MSLKTRVPEVTDKQKFALYSMMKKDSTSDFSYFFLVGLAAIVATLGLLMNSTTIIIGAMLISPIMKPILSVSFSITTGDSKLFSRSLESIIFGALFAISISVMVTLLIPARELTSEILSRTRPTIIDLFVALASGAAGAFIMQNNKDLTVLPGVAIATALMPPVSVIGIGIALTNFNVALGGFLSFLSNLIAINLAAAVIFKLVGITTQDEITFNDGTLALAKPKKSRFVWSVTAFIIISIPLTYFLINTIDNERVDQTIATSLHTVISSYENVDLVNYAYDLSENKYKVNAVVRSDKDLYGSDVRKMENDLERALNKPAEITLKIIFASEVNALTSPPPSPEPGADNNSAADTPDTSATVTNPDKFIQYTLEEKCEQIDAGLIDFTFSYSSTSAIYTIIATISGDKAQVDSIAGSITTTLEDEFNRKINLITNIAETDKPSATPAQTIVEPSDNIYDISPPA